MNSKFHKTYLLNWKNDYNSLGEKITIATLKNGLSLNLTLLNIESAAIPTNKTIAAYAWVHLSFPKVLILGHLQ